VAVVASGGYRVAPSPRPCILLIAFRVTDRSQKKKNFDSGSEIRCSIPVIPLERHPPEWLETSRESGAGRPSFVADLVAG
jgi:hypothetical protein